MEIRRRVDSPWFVVIESYRWPSTWSYDGDDIPLYGARVTLKCYPSNRIVLQRYVTDLCGSREQAMKEANDLIVVLAEELAVMADG
jgi:hypothetical protein